MFIAAPRSRLVSCVRYEVLRTPTACFTAASCLATCQSYNSDIERRYVAQKVLKLIAGLPKGARKQRHGVPETRHGVTESSHERFTNAIRLRDIVRSPESWTALGLELADSPSAAPLALNKALSPQILVVPDVEGAADYRCHLTLRGTAQRFAKQCINVFLIRAFSGIARSSPKVHLSRFDLFHGHLFLSRGAPNRLGILFHAAEYPALDPTFKGNLGYCQVDSPLRFEQRAFDLRNWVLFQERLVSLDAGEGSMLHKGLLMEGLKPMRTMLEADFGEPLADLYFFPSLQGENAVNKLFVCPLKAA